ncbi:hypothetical protein CG747_44980, partial [Streptomyces sp. CB02959]
VRLDVPTPTFMRAPGEAPGSFALECALDELAEKCGIDPIALPEAKGPAEGKGRPGARPRRRCICRAMPATIVGPSSARAPGVRPAPAESSTVRLPAATTPGTPPRRTPNRPADPSVETVRSSAPAGRSGTPRHRPRPAPMPQRFQGPAPSPENVLH